MPSKTGSTVAPGNNRRVRELEERLVSEPPQTRRLTDERFGQADGLRGNGHSEAPPIRWNDGRLTDEALHRVARRRGAALLVLAGHVGEVVRADGSSPPLRPPKNTSKAPNAGGSFT